MAQSLQERVLSVSTYEALTLVLLTCTFLIELLEYIDQHNKK